MDVGARGGLPQAEARRANGWVDRPLVPSEQARLVEDATRLALRELGVSRDSVRERSPQLERGDTGGAGRAACEPDSARRSPLALGAARDGDGSLKGPGVRARLDGGSAGEPSSQAAVRLEGRERAGERVDVGSRRARVPPDTCDRPLPPGLARSVPAARTFSWGSSPVTVIGASFTVPVRAVFARSCPIATPLSVSAATTTSEMIRQTI
jgi:hypothetical protein